MSTNIFDNPVLNKLTRTNSLFVIRIYVLTSAAIFAYGFMEYETALDTAVSHLLFGLLSFTLVEYLLHRFLYHSGEDYMNEQNWQYKVHGIHHDHPREKELLAMPLLLAFVLAVIFFFLFYSVLEVNTFYFFPGFLSGYAAYLFVHYKIHTRKPPQNFLKYLWIHHHIHHHLHDDKAYGVSSPLWDVVFRTMPPLKKRAEESQ